MSDTINVELRNDRNVGLRFDQLEKKSHEHLLVAITDITNRMEAAVRAAAPIKTGKLKATILASVIDKEKRITGRVFISADFAKAGALEFGGKGKAFTVKEHQSKLDHIFNNKLSGPISVRIGAHSRTLNMKARRFIRGPAKVLQDSAINEMREAIGQAVAETDQ